MGNQVIQFCCGGKKCPVVEPKGTNVVIGGKEEGYTTFDKDQFRDLVKAAKEGKFDVLCE